MGYPMHWTGRGRSFQLTAALLLGANALFAQSTGTISGRVTATSDQPLVGAQIHLVGSALGTRTGDAGRYTIVNVPAGQYRVRAQMLGHRPIEATVVVAAGQTVSQDFVMKAEAIG